MGSLRAVHLIGLAANESVRDPLANSREDSTLLSPAAREKQNDARPGAACLQTREPVCTLPLLAFYVLQQSLPCSTHQVLSLQCATGRSYGAGSKVICTVRASIFAIPAGSAKLIWYMPEGTGKTAVEASIFAIMRARRRSLRLLCCARLRSSYCACARRYSRQYSG